MNTRTIETIQRAGTALFEAQKFLAEDLQRQHTRVVESLAAKAFGIEPDNEFENWKSIARMAQSLATMEEHLKKVYATAVALQVGTPVPDLLAIGFQAQPKPAGEVIDLAAAKVTKRRRSALRPTDMATQSQMHVAPQPEDPLKTKASPKVRGNAAKVFEYLKATSSLDGLIRASHADIHGATNVPLGSLNFSIASLKSKGLIEEVERGTYRLSPNA